MKFFIMFSLFSMFCFLFLRPLPNLNSTRKMMELTRFEAGTLSLQPQGFQLEPYK